VLDAALAGTDDGGRAGRRTGEPPLRDEMATLEGAFVAAIDRGDVRDAVGSLLDLDTAIAARVRAGEDSPDLDNASATFRSLIVRLGERAGAGAGIPRETADELVRALLAVRETARGNRDYETADLIRDRLTGAGIEVRDGENGSTWVLAEEG
jgi:cysteinyl-tRNA synthetase